MRKIWILPLLVISSAAMAQDANQAGRRACLADARRLCTGIKPGEGRIKECLVAKSDQLSAACKAVMQAGAPPKS